MWCFPLVVNRALLTGLIIVGIVELLTRTHENASVLEQVPSAVRFTVYPFNICAAVMFVDSVVTVGTMCSPLASA